MKQFIKIKFQKSPTDKHCKRCKWYCEYPTDENDEIIHECLLFCNQLQFVNNQSIRHKQCVDAEFYEDKKRYLKYEIFSSDYETCGGCILQYHSILEDGQRVCPVFNKVLIYTQGYDPQQGYQYEYHYRCQSCRNAIIGEN